MKVTISYKKISSQKRVINQVLFVDRDYSIIKLKKYFSDKEFYFLSDLLKSKDFKKKFISFEISSKKKIILVSIDKEINAFGLENLGGKFFDTFKNSKTKEFIINADTLNCKLKNGVGYFLHGIKLKSYSFEKYFFSFIIL